MNAYKKDIARVNRSKSRLLINSDNLLKNLQYLKKNSQGCKVLAVVKGNAYGVGAKEVVSIIDAYVDGYAVDTIAEAIGLRELGIRKKILVFEGGIRDCLDLVVDYDLTPGVCDKEQLLKYNNIARAKNKNQKIWLLANVGFNRSGYRSQKDFTEFVKAADDCAHIIIEGIYAHLTNSHSNEEVSINQINDFFDLVRITEKIAGKKICTSLFASHAILRWANTYKTDWIRPGIIMYGEHIYESAKLNAEVLNKITNLKSTLQLKARIMSIIDVDKNQSIGYNLSHILLEDTRFANVSIGFGKGFPGGNLSLPVIINDTYSQTIGNAGMDITQVDITHVENVRTLDWVVFFGEVGDKKISLHTFLKNTNLSFYEFITNLKVYNENINL